MIPDLRHRASEITEEMDDGACDPEELAKTYAQFATVNRLVSGWGSLYRRRLRPAFQSGARTVLDVGCGGGDVVRYLAKMARDDGFEVEFLGIDPDPRAIEFALGQPVVPGVQFECLDLYSLSRQCDLLISNHVLHHLDETEIPRFCEASMRCARLEVVHSDLQRSSWAFLLFPVVGAWFRGSFILEDGKRSIRRAYSVAELSALAPTGWRVRPAVPFHLELSWTAST